MDNVASQGRPGSPRRAKLKPPHGESAIESPPITLPRPMFEGRLLTRDTNVLITGATGLIGGELIRRLLSSDIGRVSCLIRPSETADARSRLIERLRLSGDSLVESDDRLEALAGNVAMPDFGLSGDDLAKVADSVDMIIHCASELSFIRDAHCLETNVSGMHNLIALARRCRRNPLIVHLGTVASCGAVTHQCLSENDICDPDNEHHNEYTRSKAIAERVLRDSGEPCLILRPSITLSAGIPARKFARAIAWFIPLLQEFEAVPIDPASRVDIVPVSFVADAIDRLLRKPYLHHDCYNISAGPHAATICGPVFAFLDHFYKRAEPLKLIAPSQWTKEIHRRYLGSAQRRKLFSTFRYYLPFLNMDVVYDNARLRAELGDAFPMITPAYEYGPHLLNLIAGEEKTTRRIVERLKATG